MNKTEDGEYRNFITMLKQLSTNVLLIKALEQMTSYDKFMEDMVKKDRLVSFEDDDRMQHCSVIAKRLLCKGKKIKALSLFHVPSVCYNFPKHYVISMPA